MNSCVSKILFLHGLDSSRESTKFHAIDAKRKYCINVDYRNLNFQTVADFYHEIIEKIKACESPFRCAAIGQTRRFKIRDDWENIKVSVMEQAIRARFDQHLELAKALKFTKRKLYDHSAADNFWGIGVDGHGTNMTGEILMKIRRELQNADEEFSLKSDG